MAPTVEQRTLKMLIAKKEYYFSKIQALFDLTKNLDDSAVREKFIKQVESLEKTRTDLGQIVDQVILLRLELEEGFEPKYDILDTVDQMCDYIRDAKRTLQVGNGDHSPNSAGRLGEGPTWGRGSARLPKIELPQFSGDLREWEAFYDMFKSLVHENRNLTDMDKLYYLVGCLKGQAKTICAGLSMSQDNYEVVWDALVQRYHDKRALANAYLGQILEWRDFREESEKGLNSFLEKFDASVRALRNLNLRDLADFMFLHHALSKLNSETVNYFEINRHADSVPEYEELLEFIKLRVKTLATMKTKGFGKTKDPDLFKVKSPSKSFVVNKINTVETGTRCEHCRKSGHTLGSCLAFAKLPPKSRYFKVKDFNLCYNCLSADHGVRNCPFPSKCGSCTYKHHDLIHHEGSMFTSAHPTSEKKEGNVSLYSTESKNREKTTMILLGTAQVKVESPSGCQVGRFLLDSGSQANLVSQEFCWKLGLSISKMPSSIQGLGGLSQPVRGITKFMVSSRTDEHVSFSVTALVVNKITESLPQYQVKFRDDSWLKKICLADLDFGKPGPIEGILGAEIFSSVLGTKHLRMEDGGPVAMDTSLGYVVMGRILAEEKPAERQTFLSTLEAPTVEDLVKQFWEVEAVPETTKVLSDDDDQCEKYFSEGFFRDETGRFTVSLPFKMDPNKLGDSKKMARRRFLALESRLNKNPSLKKAYVNAMEDFINQGHIYLVNEENSEVTSYYIPHHAVYKASSESTPVRIVLDASAPSDNGLSLNSVLHCGPKLQADIGGILMKFRLFPVGLIADIRQMYRQINVAPSHRKFQRLLWRWSVDEPLNTWELGTLAFGVTSSPYLALRCVKELIRQEGYAYPKTASLAEESLYMDDLVISLPTVNEAETLFLEAVQLFRKGKFELTKWASNSEEILEKIPIESRMRSKTSVKFEGKTSILGLIWDPSEDIILINFPVPASECTKRSVLSSVARCFDPIGLSAPLTLYLKILVKELWNLKLGWDEDVPRSIQQHWKRINTEWHALQRFSLRRSCNLTWKTSIKLFGFADASKDGYGGVIYLQEVDNRSNVQFFCAKSRVSPVKFMSIPRLELCAALLLTKLMVYVTEVLREKLNISGIFGFSDSSTVLQWLSSEDLKDIFVRNRVLRIKELLPQIVWNHIAGKDNPADVLSRGLSPVQLVENKLWLHGPSWITLSEEEWPCVKFNSDFKGLKTLTTVHNPVEEQEKHPLLKLVERKSSWSEILRVTVWVLRYLKILPKQINISVSDLQTAERTLIMLVQKTHFEKDLRLLQEGKDPTSQLRSLRPFIHNGVLRVGGRLSYSNVPYNQRHQYILPKRDCLSERIIDYYHLKYMHTGSYLVEALIRQKYWIVGGRSLIKKRIRLCNRCFRSNPKPVEPLMADLPEQRVNPAKAFLKVGVDYFGPIKITMGRRRGASTTKAYVALFVCMAVKAIHLELVSSLSTNHFLQAFKRFISRRGPCQVLYSDRGSNFVGAKRVLTELEALVRSENYNAAIGNELLERRIEWNFNPAAAPHMGGIWESQVKAVKRHLFRVIGEQVLSYEEINTLLIQVEALLNSRPLCQLSSDPSAPSALTPAHFLTTAPLENLPAENLQEVKTTRLDRFQLLDQMVQSFWRRWHVEYLTTLQERQKWSKKPENVKLGSVVVLRIENSPPLNWPLAIITELLPGRDGVVRTVRLRCGQKEIVRPVIKVCPLPSQ